MFVNREKELTLLEREYKKEGFGFCIIYGRRRIGKTTLIKEFIKDKKHIYFLTTLESEKTLLQKFKDIASYSLNDPILKSIEISSFETLFSYIASKNEKIVIVIDEFQYLSKVNPAISSIFQSIIDNILKDTQIFLILCGSIISLMYKETLSYNSPLYGRRTCNLKLSALEFKHIQYFFPKKSPKELIEIYSVFYGIPKYLEMIGEEDIFTMIKENVLNKDAFLYQEPYFLLQDEVSEYITYFSILEVIAEGAHKIGEIASRLGKNVNNITSFIKKLMDLEIIYKDIPITEKNPSKSKKGLYFIQDNFLRFWFRYVFSYKSQLEIGNTQFVLDKVKATFSEFVSKTFENLAISYTLRRFELKKCGRWWNKDNEIDLLGIGDKFVIFGECKWQNKKIDINVYNTLKEKSTHIDIGLPKKYILFSKEGFSGRLIELSKKENLLLVTPYDLFA